MMPTKAERAWTWADRSWTVVLVLVLLGAVYDHHWLWMLVFVYWVVLRLPWTVTFMDRWNRYSFACVAARHRPDRTGLVRLMSGACTDPTDQADANHSERTENQGGERAD